MSNDLTLQDIESRLGSVRVDFREVGLREGLQSHGSVLSTGQKVEIFDRLVRAGNREINAVAFVHPQKMPQMADAEELLRSLGALREGIDISALVPNERGLRRAIQMRSEGLLDTIFLVFAESTAALEANGMTPTHEPLLKRIEAWSDEASATGLRVSVFISTAYGCSVKGAMDPASVTDHAARINAMEGVDELVISDSTGQADPLQVQRLLWRLAEVLPTDRRLGLHFHDTRGAGLANLYSALMSPFSHVVVDAAFGGWGGDWPMLAEAFGNVASEDVLEMLIGLGVDIGVDVDQVLDITRDYAALVDRRIEARLPSASSIGWKHDLLAARSA